MMAKLGEGDTAWIAADRASALAEASGDTLAVAAAMYRMAHVFLSLDQIGQAQQVAAATAAALEPRTKGTIATPEAQSLYGACQLVLAVTAARDNDRGAAYRQLDLAREVAEKVGNARDDYGTEFGPVNVAIHAVSVAVDLGDAGHALDLARDINYQALSPERQARHMIDLAAAHAMRRQIGEAIHDLQQAEQLTPELTHAHHAARLVTATSSSSPDSDPGPSCANWPSDSESCPSRQHRNCDDDSHDRTPATASKCRRMQPLTCR
jgi:hypothetical protein